MYYIIVLHYLINVKHIVESDFIPICDKCTIQYKSKSKIHHSTSCTQKSFIYIYIWGSDLDFVGADYVEQYFLIVLAWNRW